MGQYLGIMQRRGDWDCPQCGKSNFASRDKCFGCGCFRSKAFNQSVTTVAKPGDWNCSCGDLNFASRSSCRKCGKPKTGTPISKPGDWNCTCGELNFASRTSCRKCGVAKDGNSSATAVLNMTTINTTNSSPVDDSCIICMDRKKDTVITVCGHLGYCGMCALNMSQCPICRQVYDPDKDLLKIYNV